MPKKYLTVAEYSAKYNIPKTTLYTWEKEGKLKFDKTSFPFKLLDTGKAPVKDDGFHGWRYHVDWDKERKDYFPL